jgi:hypothetical protein
MLKADLFAYLAAFVTIVLAIALSDLVMSTHRLLRARKRVKWDVLPLLMAAYVYFTLLSEFFSLWTELSVERFAYIDLVGAMVVPSPVSLAAFAVLPDEVPTKGLSLNEFYFGQRRYLVILFLLIMTCDLTRNFWWAIRQGYFDRPDLWAWFAGLAAIHLVIFWLIWSSGSRRVQFWALVALIAAGWTAYFQWRIEAVA